MTRAIAIAIALAAACTPQQLHHWAGVLDLDVDPHDPAHLALLHRAAALAALAHAPFLADAAPALLGLHDLTLLPQIHDLAAAQSGPRFAAWHALRANPDARHLALCLPRFLLRPPHDSDHQPAALHHREERTRREARGQGRGLGGDWGLVPNQRNPCFLCKNFYHKGHKEHKEGFILLKSLCSL